MNGTEMNDQAGIREEMRIKRKTDDLVRTIGSGEPGYPALLKEIRNYPKTLYCIGDPSLLLKRCICVVGSRTTTAYGRNTARHIAGALASCGVTVVSGMAAGIDTCAHEGALAEGGATAAVLGCGPDICYPPSNAALKRSIERTGLIVSEYPPGTEPMKHRFPERNRIISGLSEAAVIVQARNRSGALITAEWAQEQGRQVFAVPGNIDSQYNLGTNRLIWEGTDPLVSVSDLLDLLHLSPAGSGARELSLSRAEAELFRLIRDSGEMTADEISLRTGKRPAYVNPILSALELKGFIVSDMGKFFLANQIDTSYNRKL